MTRKCLKCGEELSYLESSAKWSCWKCGEAFTLKDAGGIPPPPPPPEEEYSESGARIYRHEERKRAFEHALGNEEEIELISNHVEKHIGEISGSSTSWSRTWCMSISYM